MEMEKVVYSGLHRSRYISIIKQKQQENRWKSNRLGRTQTAAQPQARAAVRAGGPTVRAGGATVRPSSTARASPHGHLMAGSVPPGPFVS